MNSTALMELRLLVLRRSLVVSASSAKWSVYDGDRCIGFNLPKHTATAWAKLFKFGRIARERRRTVNKAVRYTMMI